VAADITLTVLTAGGGTAAVTAAKTGVKQGTKIGFSQAAKTLGKNLSKATISDQIKKAAMKAGKEVAESTAEAWGAALVEAGTTGEFEWESLDPTGIASIVKAYNHPICNPPSTPTTTTASPAAAAGPGCDTEGAARSAGGGQPVQITFRNSTAGNVKLYWLDYNGKRQLYKTLTPGESYIQSTYIGHPWLAANATDQCIELFQPASSTTLNIISR
jgi:VHL beta domain